MTATDALSLAKAIYRAMAEDSPDAFMSGPESVGEPYLGTTIDGRWDLVKVAARVLELIKPEGEG